jgi:hypothetical protein
MSLPFKLMKAVLIWGQSGDDAMIREIVQKTQCQTIPQNSTIVLFQLQKKAAPAWLPTLRLMAYCPAGRFI